MRIPFILFCAAVALSVSYFGQPFARNNTDLITVVITVITVFAGFLVTIIAVLGDPALIPSGSWRIVTLHRDTIENRLIWHSWLFVLYLVTIAFLFAGVLLAKIAPTKSGDAPHACMDWAAIVEHGYLFFAVFSFLLTLALPWSLKRIQQARVDAEEERRRKADGVPCKPD